MWLWSTVNGSSLLSVHTYSIWQDAQPTPACYAQRISALEGKVGIFLPQLSFDGWKIDIYQHEMICSTFARVRTKPRNQMAVAPRPSLVSGLLHFT